MRTTIRTSTRRESNRSSGFTLLEVLAVLFVIGMVSSIVIPNLPGLKSSLDFALNRETFEQGMNALAYEAFKNDEDYLLLGTYDNHGQVGKPDMPHDDADDGIPGQLRTLPILETTHPVPKPVNPAKFIPPVPAGWQIEVREPIQYHASGFCTGGTIALDVGQSTYTYRAVPPLCELTLER